MKTRLYATVLLLIAGVVLCSVAWAGTVEPRVLTKHQVAPKYPPAAQMAKFGGSVTVAAQIKTDGSVGLIEVVESDHPNLGFEAAASDAVSQWKFHPAEVDGLAVEATTFIRLHFRADNSLRPRGYVAGGAFGSTIGGVVPGGVGKGSPGPGGERTASNGTARIQTVDLPPMSPGALYDRTKLIPRPESGLVDQPVSVAPGR